MLPVTGFHSTIESPDSVSRVAPPTSTISAIKAATEISHQRTARCGSDGVDIVVISGPKPDLNPRLFKTLHSMRLEPDSVPLIVPRSRSASYAKPQQPIMSSRTRKFLGTILLLVLAT